MFTLLLSFAEVFLNWNQEWAFSPLPSIDKSLSLTPTHLFLTWKRPLTLPGKRPGTSPGTGHRRRKEPLGGSKFRKNHLRCLTFSQASWFAQADQKEFSEEWLLVKNPWAEAALPLHNLVRTKDRGLARKSIRAVSGVCMDGVWSEH